MRYNRDIETELYKLLTEAKYSASAHVLPATLGADLPHVHVVRTGGYESDLVIETNYIDFDVYAEDDPDAMTAAGELCGWVRDLAGDHCYMSSITTLPYQIVPPILVLALLMLAFNFVGDGLREALAPRIEDM